jgi:hypothetical protein
VTLSQAIQSLQDAFTMGQIGRVVSHLNIPDALQGLVRCEQLLG